MNKLLVQEWFAENFNEPSEVSFTLDGDDQKTSVKLVQKGVPDDLVEDISAGWQQYYLGAIKKLLET